MPKSADEAIELRLAEAGSELRAAVEAAQYAQLVSPEALRTRAEQVAVARFVQAFGACVESWQEQAETARRETLTRLAPHLEALEMHGLFVHWGVARRALMADQGRIVLPLAILTIGRSALRTRTLILPRELLVDSAQSGPRH